MYSCFDAFTDIETNFHGFFRELAHFNFILDGELISVSSRDSLFSQAINYIFKLNFRHEGNVILPVKERCDTIILAVAINIAWSDILLVYLVLIAFYTSMRDC